ncbi:hypothetical protein GWI33_011114 [Rhynchophorus ferrugineus]|uniref:Polyprenal reductase n=1 Tax=Rhynchophorus ferrugineus TaxID=354439 RepID=A0A834ISN0_RHYFE|nr:hypothetical protein GWI33_011114 [Rhynchophorus ferrugineus]
MLCGEERFAHTPKNRIFIAVCLMTLQIYRRFYDTHYVSVFGQESKMHIFHYVVGHVHYPGAALAILCEAPIFTRTKKVIADASFRIFDLTLSEVVIIAVFLLAWRHQQICTRILAELRKNSKGEVVSNEYNLPNGDWFHYLTAPHQTTEIIMYASVMWLLWHHISWFFVFTWVLVNQVETILLSHWWYQENFKDFPKKRKALIPFLY